MRLPAMKYSDGNTKAVQMQFGGYNHTRAARDGELWDMLNLSSEEYPLIVPRKPRCHERTMVNQGAIGGHDKLFWVDDTTFYYNGVAGGTVTAGDKQFAGMGSRIIIWPDKKVYYLPSEEEEGRMEDLEASVTLTSVKFANGTIYGEEAEANTIINSGVDWNDYFAVGDAVEISGCTTHPENNKTPIIREISEDGTELRFYEYVFTLDGTDESPKDYTEPGTITFKRTVPDMDFICVNENRLWGCKGDTVYASALGDPKNFNVFDGLDTDSYWVEAGSAGAFTGCISFLGYPCFFKQTNIYKMFGDLPSNFQLMGSAVLGVAEGSGKSLAIAGETLFYLSTAGIMAYTGGIPSPVSDQLGDSFRNAVAGSDGLKYYVSMQDSRDAWHLFVYDSRKGLWHREDSLQARGFARVGSTLYVLQEGGTVFDLTTGGNEETVAWMAEFADFTEGSLNAKGYGKLQIRMELDTGSTAKVELRYDSAGQWQTVGEMTAQSKRTFLLPVIPRRADHYRLRISGTGGAVIYGIARQYFSGSENRTM